MQTLLLIDDDPVLRELLSSQLQAAGYRVQAAPDGPTGLILAAEASPDLVVLDVMMPGMDGWEVCRRLREKSPAAVIMLTAKGTEIDKLRGFRLGVDDYVTKPFSFAELMARVGAVLARVERGRRPTHRLTSGDLTIDFDQRRVSVAGRAVELTPTEYRLLELLAHHAKRPVPSETLLEQVWGAEYAGEIEHVKHFIWTLRKKIEADPGDPKHLITERGFGYRLE
ncbi:MAG: response regulator transcription factor [Chloroflexi bacterium]|nr:response regulator transcription factor [Chloroflexota bacterium]